MLTARLATEADLATLTALMNLAIAENLKPFLTPGQVAASHAIMGLDTALIADRTYFVVEDGGQIVGCGGWSRRNTLYGGDHTAGRNATPLDPATEAARVRAMYTHPSHIRRGVGGMILDMCAKAAAAEGFSRLELAATLAGEPLYLKHGYTEIERFVDGGVPLVRMGKSIGD